MALTARKTVAMFMRYDHTEDDPVRKVAERVVQFGQQAVVHRVGLRRTRVVQAIRAVS
jgi:hypothetical protein